MWEEEKIASFREKLLAWYDANKRDLPWRRTQDPYKIWISEIMLQQTRVDTVIPYYERFLDWFPTVADLAQAPEEKEPPYDDRSLRLHDARAGSGGEVKEKLPFC